MQANALVGRVAELGSLGSEPIVGITGCTSPTSTGRHSLITSKFLQVISLTLT